MKKDGRYSTAGLVEDQYEPGSKGEVLKNLVGIKSRREMERIETELLFEATDQLIDEYDQEHRFSAADICRMHKLWLGSVYEWAGHYRQVMMSKGGFVFAAPAQIPNLMLELEKDILRKSTPCAFTAEFEICTALAVVHTELMLIHPFREGNGRVGRLLSTLMALQAGLPPLDFSEFQGERKEEYFAAVGNGLDRNYAPMEKVFRDVILRSLQAFAE